MKAFIKCMPIMLSVMSLAFLSSCTIGPATATAGYVPEDGLSTSNDPRMNDRFERNHYYNN